MIDIKTNYPNCPIRYVISRFGDKWSILVLWTLHDCPGGVLRFSELSRSMADCSQKMLAATLKNLERSLSRGATPGGVFAYGDWALAYSGAGDADRVGRATLRRGDRRGVVKRTAPRAYRRPEGREKGYPSPEKEVDTLFTFLPAGIGCVDGSEARAGSAAAARTAAPGASAPATASAAEREASA